MYMLLLVVSLVSIFMQINGAELIGTAIQLNNKTLAAQLIAAAGLTDKSYGYKKAWAKWNDIGDEVAKFKKSPAVGKGLPSAISDLAKGKDGGDGVQALAALLTGYGIKEDTAGQAVLKALSKDQKSLPSPAKLKNLYDDIIKDVKKALA